MNFRKNRNLKMASLLPVIRLRFPCRHFPAIAAILPPIPAPIICMYVLNYTLLAYIILSCVFIQHIRVLMNAQCSNNSLLSGFSNVVVQCGLHECGFVNLPITPRHTICTSLDAVLGSCRDTDTCKNQWFLVLK